MRDKIYRLLHESRTGNILIVLLILISLLSYTLGTEYKNNKTLHAINYGISLIFAVEYALRVWIAPLHYKNSQTPYRDYILSTNGLIDLFAFLPALLLPMAEGSIAIRLLRIMRLFQLMKIPIITSGLRRMGRALKKSRIEMALSVALSMSLIFIGAVLMYIVEGKHNPEGFGSVPRALWWSVETLTTVGYGDVYPTTPLGKFVASWIAIFGVIAVALPAGILASAFSSSSGAPAPRKPRKKRPKARRKPKDADSKAPNPKASPEASPDV